eukprot:1243374-Pleurochrysis_carterae.AAC.3
MASATPLSQLRAPLATLRTPLPSPSFQDDRLDMAIANHIVALHQHSDLSHIEAQPAYTTSELQRYIRYARALKPQLSDEASRVLVEAYKDLRRGDMAEAGGSYRVTVRQLEALIRLGEARARVELDHEVKGRHIAEAKRLLKQSIIHVERDPVDVMADDEMDEELQRQAEMAEEAERRRQAQGDSADGGDGADGADDPDGRGGRDAKGASAKPASDLQGARKASTCTFEKFRKVARSIILYIRAHEVPSERAGIRLGDVIEWYLNQQEVRSHASRSTRARTPINCVASPAYCLCQFLLPAAVCRRFFCRLVAPS